MEKSLISPIRPMLITAPRTGLRSVARINRHHLHCGFLGFVGEEVPELAESPAMQPATGFGFLLELGPVSKLGQVFYHDGCARGGPLHDAFGENMVAIPVESPLPARQLSEVAFGRLCSFGLQLTPDTEITPVYFFPGFSSQEFPFGSDRWMVEAEVHPDSLAPIPELHIGQANN